MASLTIQQLDNSVRALTTINAQLVKQGQSHLSLAQQQYQNDRKTLTALDKISRIGFGAAKVGLGVGAGLVAKGFQNTVEMNRFNNELMLLSRTIAGTFAPALEYFTDGLRKSRQNLEKAPVSSTSLGAVGLGMAGAGLLLTKLSSMLGIGASAGAGGGRLALAGAAIRGAGPFGLAVGGALALSQVPGMMGAGQPIRGGDRPFKDMSDEQLKKERDDQLKKPSEKLSGVLLIPKAIGAGIFDAINLIQRQLTGKNYARDSVMSRGTQLTDELKERGELGGKSKVTQAGAGFQPWGTGMEKFAIALSNVDKTDTERDADKRAKEALDAANRAADNLEKLWNHVRNQNNIFLAQRP